MSEAIVLSTLARELGAELYIPEGSSVQPTAVVRGVAPIHGAKDGHVTFLTNPQYESHAATTPATAVITAKRIASCPRAQLVHKNPYWAFAMTAQRFFKHDDGPIGVSPLAYVHADAKIGQGVTIYPHAYVAEKAVIGDHAVLYPGVFVGRGAVVGERSVLRANVVVEHGVKVGRRVLVHGGSVLGADGFGFAPGEQSIAKIPQIGTVVVGDDVEIGGLTTVDRGALTDTVIGEDSKLDSAVHIGHGSKTGKHCMVCGMAGMAGSATLGDWVTVAGLSGIVNNVTVGDRITVGGMSAPTKDLEGEGKTFIGYPAMEAGDWRRQIVLMRNLPKLLDRVKELEAKLASLESRNA